jgi:hypothetical protein
MELLSGDRRPDIFRKLLKKEAGQLPKDEVLADKSLKAYARMKLKAGKKNKKRKTGRTQWKPRLQELVLVKSQPASDEAQGITSKFQRPYEEPYLIHKKINPNNYELCDKEGHIFPLVIMRKTY